MKGSLVYWNPQTDVSSAVNCNYDNTHTVQTHFKSNKMKQVFFHHSSPVEWVNEGMNNCLIDWLIDGINEWLSERMLKNTCQPLVSLATLTSFVTVEWSYVFLFVLQMIDIILARVFQQCSIRTMLADTVERGATRATARRSSLLYDSLRRRISMTLLTAWLICQRLRCFCCCWLWHCRRILCHRHASWRTTSESRSIASATYRI